MKKVYLIFIIYILFYSNKSISQESKSSGIVSYTFYMNLGMATESDWDLIFQKSKSIFLGNSNLKYSDKNFAKGQNFESYEIKVNDDLTPHIINNFKNDSIYSQGLVFKTPYYVQDPIHDPEWKLHSETKSISGFECNKATTTFRGRTYEVWYTPEIPVNFGPWKLNGLPGLILQASDTKGQIEFRANKVSLNQEFNVDEQISKLPKLGEKVTLREYVDKKDKEGEQISRYTSSKGSRGTGSETTFENPENRNAIEIIYEWEED